MNQSPLFGCNGRNRKYSIGYHKIWFMSSGKTVPCMQITYVPTLCNFMSITEWKTHRRSAAIHSFHHLFFSFLICVKNSNFHSAAFNLCAVHLKNTRNLYASQSLTRFIFIRNSKLPNLIQPMNSDAVVFAAFASNLQTTTKRVNALFACRNGAHCMACTGCTGLYLYGFTSHLSNDLVNFAYTLILGERIAFAWNIMLHTNRRSYEFGRQICWAQQTHTHTHIASRLYRISLVQITSYRNVITKLCVITNLYMQIDANTFAIRKQ